VAAASTWALNAWRGSAAARAALRKPSLGSGLKIFIQPAVTVTAMSQASGTSVTHMCRALPILISTVVPSARAITARSWLATPKMGQRELIPPMGSTTPW